MAGSTAIQYASGGRSRIAARPSDSPSARIRPVVRVAATDHMTSPAMMGGSRRSRVSGRIGVGRTTAGMPKGYAGRAGTQGGWGERRNVGVGEYMSS